MQLVLSNNRVIAHGENFLAMGGVVINTETGARFENATVAECDGCPSDIDKVGYEYHGGEFVPCAPYGTGNNNGYFMEVCEGCATPKSSGIPIKGGIKNENINPEVTARTLGGLDIKLLWENASIRSAFNSQTISLDLDDCNFLLIEHTSNSDTTGDVYRYHMALIPLDGGALCGYVWKSNTTYIAYKTFRAVSFTSTGVTFEEGMMCTMAGESLDESNKVCKPLRIYGVKL